MSEGSRTAAILAALLMPLPALLVLGFGLSGAVLRTESPRPLPVPSGEQTRFPSPEAATFGRVEARVAQNLPRAKEATVSLTVENVGMTRIAGSGVVVSPGGLVLTAGHNLEAGGAGPVRVRLADGREREALVLGLDTGADTGALQIVAAPGEEFAYAEISDSEGPGPGEWCFALGHPGGEDWDRGVVLRVGQVVATSEPVVRTTCKLASGDSGGPLFDLDGCVVGIHSRITEDITENFHVRTPMFVSSWTDLAPGAMVPALAGNSIPVSEVSPTVNPRIIAAGEDAGVAFARALAQARAATVSVEDAFRPGRLCLGTAIAPSVVVTKASTLVATAELQVRFADGTLSGAVLLPGDDTDDLAYLRLVRPAPTYLRPEPPVDPATPLDRGRFVVTPLPVSDSPLGFEAGTIASDTRSIARESGLLGIRLSVGEDNTLRPQVDLISPGSATETAGIRVGDTILSVGGLAVETGRDVQEAVRHYHPGDPVAIEVLRDGKNLVFHPRLTSIKRIDHTGLNSQFARAALIDGPTSWRQSGFGQVTQHDIALRPDQMGTPLLDLKGRFIALSIARVDRVTTLALPASAIHQPLR